MFFTDISIESYLCHFYGVITEDEDEEIEIDFNKNEMKVNDNKIPDELFEKYKVLYKEHFGKEPDDDTHFRIN